MPAAFGGGARDRLLPGGLAVDPNVEAGLRERHRAADASSSGRVVGEGESNPRLERGISIEPGGRDHLLDVRPGCLDPVLRDAREHASNLVGEIRRDGVDPGDVPDDEDRSGPSGFLRTVGVVIRGRKIRQVGGEGPDHLIALELLVAGGESRGGRDDEIPFGPVEGLEREKSGIRTRDDQRREIVSPGNRRSTGTQERKQQIGIDVECESGVLGRGERIMADVARSNQDLVSRAAGGRADRRGEMSQGGRARVDDPGDPPGVAGGRAGIRGRRSTFGLSRGFQQEPGVGDASDLEDLLAQRFESSDVAGQESDAGHDRPKRVRRVGERVSNRVVDRFAVGEADAWIREDRGPVMARERARQESPIGFDDDHEGIGPFAIHRLAQGLDHRAVSGAEHEQRERPSAFAGQRDRGGNGGFPRRCRGDSLDVVESVGESGSMPRQRRWKAGITSRFIPVAHVLERTPFVAGGGFTCRPEGVVRPRRRSWSPPPRRRRSPAVSVPDSGR